MATRAGPWTATARRASGPRRDRERSGAEDEDGRSTRATTGGVYTPAIILEDKRSRTEARRTKNEYRGAVGKQQNNEQEENSKQNQETKSNQQEEGVKT